MVKVKAFRRIDGKNVPIVIDVDLERSMSAAGLTPREKFLYRALHEKHRQLGKIKNAMFEEPEKYAEAYERLTGRAKPTSFKTPEGKAGSYARLIIYKERKPLSEEEEAEYAEKGRLDRDLELGKEYLDAVEKMKRMKDLNPRYFD